MVTRSIFIHNLLLVYYYRKTDGVIVECGCWKGGMSASMSLIAKKKKIFLFDSFEGLPEAKEIDGPEAIKWQSNTRSKYYYDNCKANVIDAENIMKFTRSDKYHIIKGWFNDTLKNFDESIAILRIDADWYDSVYTCLEYLYPRVTKGGLIIIDDYINWDGCAKSVHDYFNNKCIPVRIRQFNNNVIYIIK